MQPVDVDIDIEPLEDPPVVISYRRRRVRPERSSSLLGEPLNVGKIDWEAFWNEHRSFFEARGYVLCSTSCPGYSKLLKGNDNSSWAPGLIPTNWNDGKPSCPRSIPYPEGQPMHTHTIAATKTLGNRLVYIKAVHSDFETDNIERLHQGYARVSPANHCTPVLSSFKVEKVTFIVMPALCSIVPTKSFKRVGDVVEFVSQVLLGISHMHNRNVSHRDCSFHNILTDVGDERLQLLHQHGQSDGVSLIPPRRSATSSKSVPSPPKYFINDLSASNYGDRSSAFVQAEGIHSRDTEAPEYVQFSNVYNPFQLDIFLIGNMLRKEFIKNYSNVDFLQELIDDMIEDQPSLRPTASECLGTWCDIIQHLPSKTRRRRLLRRNASGFAWVVPTDVSPLLRYIFRRAVRAQV